MATISNTPRPGYVFDVTDNVWYPIGTGSHNHSEIASTIVDAKGDIITASAADTPARLAVGSDGETLVADSSTATGLRYQGNFAAGKNKIINGALDIWQRGTSGAIVAGSYVGADRFYTYRGVAGSTFSRQTSGLTGFQYSGRIARDSANTSTTNISVGQSIETSNAIAFAGQTVTISFYAKAGANYSAASSILRVRVLSSTTQDQNIVLNGGVSVIDQNATLTTSWQRFTYSGSVASNTLTVGQIFSYDPVGTAGAADNFEFTGVMIEVGSVATAFQTATGTLQGELAACQRYYQRISSDATATLANFGAFGMASTTTSAEIYGSKLPVAMRIAPTTLDYANVGVRNASGTVFAATVLTIASYGTTNQVVAHAVTSSGLTSGASYGLVANSSSAAYVGLGAEL